MKKQNYSKPFMVAEKFIPQEYCHVCFDTQQGGEGYGGFLESNGIPGPQVNKAGTAVINGEEVHYEPDHAFTTHEEYYIRSNMSAFEWVMAKDRPAQAPTGDPDFHSVPWMAWYGKDTNGGQFSYIIDIYGDVYYHLNYRPTADAGNHS